MLGYTLLSLDIIQISKMDFERILVKSCWHFVEALPSQKKDITDFWGLRKPLISWRNHRFHTRYHHSNILDSLPNKKAWTFNVNPRFVFYRSKWTIIAAWFRFGKVKHINKRLIHRPTTSHVMSREHSLIFGSSVYNYFFDLFFVDSVSSHYNPHR